jgi:hypothetical protein
VTSATSRILGVRPKPNHSTTSGAIATSGKRLADDEDRKQRAPEIAG